MNRYVQAKTLLFDNEGLWNEVLREPSHFGFSGSDSVGPYQDTSKLWADDFHPGEAMNMLVASRLAPRLHEAFGF